MEKKKEIIKMINACFPEWDRVLKVAVCFLVVMWGDDAFNALKEDYDKYLVNNN